jgi:alanyl-tRNA synthetase
MTERLYYQNSYLTQFDAIVVDAAADGRRVYLDRSAFYPASGGQLYDLGSINGIALIEVEDEGERVAHVLASPLSATKAAGVVDWGRRFDHMQQHTGQHLLSAVFAEKFGISTLSVHLGAEISTIDLEAGSLKDETLRAAEQRANEVVFENRPVSVSYEDAATAQGLRKSSERTGELRIVTIDGLDRSACGGTHVRATGEIGPILIRKIDKVRSSVRIEFLCGLRATRRARADFDLLSQISRSFSAPLEDTPALVAAQLEAAKEADKQNRKLVSELAVFKGRDLYQATVPGEDGLRRYRHDGLDDSVRALAQSFAAQSKAMFVAVGQNPPSVLLAAATDSGVHAGNVLKAALAAAGGRGGGSATMAQGSVPTADQLPGLLRELGFPAE